MKCEETRLAGLYLIQAFFSQDSRGAFVKPFHAGVMKKRGIEPIFQECFASNSGPGVLRGMHFQLPPFDHDKLVFVLKGSITDVVVDLRRDQETFQEHFAVRLNASEGRAIYIPAGLAHGFLSHDEENIVCYLTTTVHSPDHDTGIRWDSFGYDWGVDQVILSDRDRAFPRLGQFQSPF